MLAAGRLADGQAQLLDRGGGVHLDADDIGRAGLGSFGRRFKSGGHGGIDRGLGRNGGHLGRLVGLIGWEGRRRAGQGDP